MLPVHDELTLSLMRQLHAVEDVLEVLGPKAVNDGKTYVVMLRAIYAPEHVRRRWRRAKNELRILIDQALAAHGRVRSRDRALKLAEAVQAALGDEVEHETTLRLARWLTGADRRPVSVAA